MNNLFSDFSGGIPVKGATKEREADTRAFRMGVTASSLAVKANELAQKEAQFEQSKNQLFMAMMAQQQQNQTAQQYAQYQGAQAGIKQHLDGYSQDLASQLGGGSQGQMPQQAGMSQTPQQPQMM